MQTETLQATVVVLDEGGFLIKKGSYIPLKGTETEQEARRVLERKGALTWGKHANEKTGKVLSDIHVNTPTHLAAVILGTKCYKKQKEVPTNYKKAKISINYQDELGKTVIPGEWLRGRVRGTDTERVTPEPPFPLTKETKLLFDSVSVHTGGVIKRDLAELIYLWAGKSGFNTDVCKDLLNKAKIESNTTYYARNKILNKRYLTNEGVDFNTVAQRYKNWTLTLTQKGLRRYEELVHKCIKEDKQEEYLSINKLPYEDDLKPESLYDFYTRMRTNTGTQWGDTLAIDLKQNVKQVLGVVTYYQIAVTGVTIVEDCRKIAEEATDSYLLNVLKRNLEVALTSCQEFVDNGNDKTDHQKNVIVLGNMLGVYEELVICTM